MKDENSLNSLNNCSKNFRPKSIGKYRNFPELMQSRRQEKLTSFQYPMYKTTSKLRAYKNPMTPKLLNAPMLQPILYTSACVKPLKRCDAPICMKLQSNSPYHPAEKQIETCFREQNIIPIEDGLTTDVRTI